MAHQVSIIIPTYNGLRYLVPCLASLRRQTYRGFGVLVVDDGGSDATAALIRAEFPEVALLRLPRNGGLARAVNAGIALAHSPYVVLLNNDTEAETDWLERLVAVADAQPRAWAVACTLRLWDRRDILHAAGDAYGTDGVPRNLGVWEPDRHQYDDGRWIWGPQGGAALYRREALVALSDPILGTPLDESFGMYCEDVDLAWRARLAGYETAFAPDAIVYHHVSATAGGPLASYLVGRNMLAVIAKDMPAPLLLRHWRAIVRAQLAFVQESVRHAREPAARARLRGQLAVLSMLPGLLRQRRQLHARFVADPDALDRLLYAP